MPVERKRRRIPKEVMIERMLDAGLELVNSRGLAVSFDLMRLEEVIQLANVPRTAVYDHWGTKDHFFTDLTLEIARRTGAPNIAVAPYEGDVKKLVPDNWYRDDDARQRIFVELARLGVRGTLQTSQGNRHGRLRLALFATMESMPDNESSRRLREILLQGDDAAFMVIEKYYRFLGGVLGVKEENDQSFWIMARQGFAYLTGASQQLLLREKPQWETFEDGFLALVSRLGHLIPMEEWSGPSVCPQLATAFLRRAFAGELKREDIEQVLESSPI